MRVTIPTDAYVDLILHRPLDLVFGDFVVVLAHTGASPGEPAIVVVPLPLSSGP